MSASASETVAAVARPLRTVPQPTAESQPFWDACARHELVIQRCNSCGRFWFPPSNRCQHCWSENFAWTPASGSGELYTFTVFRRAYAPELAEQLPYVVGIVELEEGPRLITNVVDCEPDNVRVGMLIEVVFHDIAEGVSLHAFRPRRTRKTPGTGAA
ncbi:MAG: nucleic acid-binding protein [Nitriliruptorales bacterium]|nr:nucleic acid-binding protein [Nitriliruptorales bacterium]